MSLLLASLPRVMKGPVPVILVASAYQGCITGIFGEKWICVPSSNSLYLEKADPGCDVVNT
jgi:hypothetical protein